MGVMRALHALNGKDAQVKECKCLSSSIKPSPKHINYLQVVCDTDDLAPGGASFCENQPIIRPLGAGLYQVEFTTGTIW